MRQQGAQPVLKVSPLNAGRKSHATKERFKFTKKFKLARQVEFAEQVTFAKQFEK
jgi:hypothetical protein